MFTTSFFFFFPKKTLPSRAPAPDSVPECPLALSSCYCLDLALGIAKPGLLTPSEAVPGDGVEAHGARPVPHDVPATLAVPM